MKNVLIYSITFFWMVFVPVWIVTSQNKTELAINNWYWGQDREFSMLFDTAFVQSVGREKFIDFIETTYPFVMTATNRTIEGQLLFTFTSAQYPEISLYHPKFPEQPRHLFSYSAVSSQALYFVLDK